MALGHVRHVAGAPVQLVVDTNSRARSLVTEGHCGSHLTDPEPTVCAWLPFVAVILGTISVYLKKGY